MKTMSSRACLTPPRQRAAAPAHGPATASERAAAPPFLHTRRWIVATLALCTTLAIIPCAAATDVELSTKGREIEAYLDGFPKRALAELEELVVPARRADASTRHYIESLYGQAMVRSNRTAEAQQLADRLESEGRFAHDDGLVAMAWLVRGAVQSWNGEVSLASRLAEDARELLGTSGDAYVRYWAALSAGTTARQMLRNDDALKALQEALALAAGAQSPYRRAEAMYQLSVRDTQMRQWAKAFDESQEAFRQAKLAGSAFTMSKAKNAESAALQYLDRPKQELDAMLESVAIARSAKSDAAESMALINLADVYLRRQDFKEVLELSQRSLELANASGNVFTAATNKANIGFAQLGLGQIEAGKRLAEQAVEEYERAGAVGEIGDLLVEYGQHLAEAGDYKGAVALFDRERKLRDEIAAVQREKTERELRESEKRKREIELLNRERSLQSVELQNRQLQQRVWWLLAAVFAASFGVVATLYRKLRTTNRLLATKNSELSFQSSRDPLTALFNRRHFQNFISEGRGESERRSGAVEKPVQALLLIDLDHFKLINDQFGHAAGDAVLIAIARRLQPSGNGHDRALGRRGIPRVRSCSACGPPRRDRHADHARRVRGTDSVFGPLHPHDRFHRLLAGDAAARRCFPRLGARAWPGGQGAVHGQAARPQSRLRRRRNAAHRRGRVGGSRFGPGTGVARRLDRHARAYREVLAGHVVDARAASRHIAALRARQRTAGGNARASILLC